jgi:hypothetical protein
MEWNGMEWNGMEWNGGACRNKSEKIVTVLCLLTKLVWESRNGMEWNGMDKHVGISLGR